MLFLRSCVADAAHTVLLPAQLFQLCPFQYQVVIRPPGETQIEVQRVPPQLAA
ncbi:hypothetical protein SBA2_90017 [Acidobacteriia bacterium SbA2]|nr:hypothetical protein SBA2_90017 [Acidobacteriia bacterium SbA2]